jgi:hypothetical protein
MKKLKYHNAKAGEKIILRSTAGKYVWLTKCCDCSLEHVILLVPKGRELHLGVWRYDQLAKIGLPPTPNRKKRHRGVARSEGQGS